MIKKLTFLLLAFLSNTLVAIAQNESSVPDLEKIYLHTDKSYYTSGESLWYKAYIVYAYTNALFDNSNVLYVELISPDSKIVARNITRINNGLGHGDIKLADSIATKTGTYQLRAYTNWMRNFGDDFVFKKDIKIVALNDQIADDSKTSSTLSSKSKDKKSNTTTSNDENLINIQFFPEGGSLIENVSGFVAFKATDKNGNPIGIEGNIYDANKNSITKFKSSHDGMGKFVISPAKDQQYYAEITDPNGKKNKTVIPKAEKTGYVMAVENVNGKSIITIKTNQETLNQKNNTPLKLIGSTRRITYYQGTQSMNDTKVSFPLPEDNFPEGIAQITLYDGNSMPQCERLLYIKKDHKIDATVIADKKQYAPREKVDLKISIKSKQNIPLTSHFSIASTDANLMSNNNDMDICSYFLMSSDIKGKVHNPGYYFDTSNSERLPHLDLLLLTQGWRDFLWKKLPAFTETIPFELEKGIKISGKVKNVFNIQIQQNTEVNLVLMKNGKSLIMKDTTNVIGKFEFDNIFFYEKAKILLNTKKEKGRNDAMFIMDSIYEQPIPAKYTAENLFSEDENKIKEFEQNVNNHNTLYNIRKGIDLKEVIIKTEKKENKRAGFGRASRYGTLDRTYFLDKDSPKFSSIYEFIQLSIPFVSLYFDAKTNKESFKFNRYQGPTDILLDGVKVEAEDLTSVNQEDVEEISTMYTMATTAFPNGAIFIYRKPGWTFGKKTEVFNTITQTINGFQKEKIFYSPDYDDPNTLTTKNNDVRNTLYWNPNVSLNKNGDAELSYYNSDVSTKVQVTIEGIIDNGIPVVIKTDYSITNGINN